MPPGPNYEQQRQSFVALMLAALLGGGFLVFMIAISGGLFLYLVLTMVGIAALGCVHYVLWGRVLSQQVAGEREELELRARMEAENQRLSGSED